MGKNIYKLWPIITILLPMTLACSLLIEKPGLSTSGGETAGKIIYATAIPRPSVGLSGAIFAPASHASDMLPAVLFTSQAATQTIPIVTDPPVRQFPEGLYSVAFSPDGKKIVAAEGAYGRVWLATGQFYHLVGHEDLVNSAVFSPDSQWVLTASQDGTARLWAAGIEAGIVIRKFEVVTESAKAVSVNAAAFSPDGQTIITGSDDGNGGGAIRFWNINGEESSEEVNNLAPVKLLAINPRDGQMILTVDDKNMARLWYGDQLIDLSEEEWRGVFAIAFSADGQRIALGRNRTIENQNRSIELWEVNEGSIIKHEPPLPIGDLETVTSVAFHPLDSNLIVIASSDQTVRLWNTLRADNPELARLKQPNVTSVAFSPTGYPLIYEFATAGKDGTIQVWRYTLEPGAPPGECFYCR